MVARLADEMDEHRMNRCKCGGSPEWVKLFERNRYDGFIRCQKCSSETKCYTSKQNAIKAWNRMNPR